jgi:hypothetical protein
MGFTLARYVVWVTILVHTNANSYISKLCEAYADGLEGLFKSLNASSIESFEDLVPILSFVEPQRALVLLRQHSEFQASSFGSLIEGFLQRTGWPLGTDPLGLASLSSGLGYDNLSVHLDNPGFRSQLLYRCATASDSLLSGQQIQVGSSFPFHYGPNIPLDFIGHIF